LRIALRVMRKRLPLRLAMTTSDDTCGDDPGGAFYVLVPCCSPIAGQRLLRAPLGALVGFYMEPLNNKIRRNGLNVKGPGDTRTLKGPGFKGVSLTGGTFEPKVFHSTRDTAAFGCDFAGKGHAATKLVMKFQIEPLPVLDCDLIGAGTAQEFGGKAFD